MSEYAESQSKTLAGFIPEVWSKKLSAMLDKSGVMMQCVNRDYEGEIKTKGDTVKIYAPGDVSVSTYTGSISSYEELSGTTTDLIIDQEKIFAFKVPDVTKAQTGIDLMNKYVERAKVALDLEKDSFLLSKHADVPAANIIGEESNPITLTSENIYSQFAKLRKVLANSNALANGQRPWVVINPDVETLLIQAPEFTHATQFGDEVLKEGMIGRVAGMDVLSCTNLAGVDVSTGSYSGEIINIIAGTADAITFASQVVAIEKNRDPNSFSDLVRGLYLYGAKTVVPNALAKIVCAI